MNYSDACNFEWLSGDGTKRTLDRMHPSHMFYVYRMIWNKVMPEECIVCDKAKPFVHPYSTDYLVTAVDALGFHLNMCYNRLPPTLRKEYLLMVDALKEYYNE